MSKIQVDAIEQQTACGTTLTAGGGAGKTVVVDATTVTLGRCGGTVALASGASQTGFGRTGTVDWQTTPKTATFTAANGEGYFCNTAGGTFEVDLPAGSAGAIVSIQDYNNTFDSNNLTVDPNGSEKINGGDAGGFITLSTEGLGLTFVYIDATVGWRSIQSNEYSTSGSNPTFICAAVSGVGNTLATVDTNFKVATFTGPGTFTVNSLSCAPAQNIVDYLVVAGGGGAGYGQACWQSGGGGGAGGYREAKTGFNGSYTVSPLSNPTGIPVSVQGYTITIGGGGAGAPPTCSAPPGTQGGPTTFSTIVSTGGGYGAGYDGVPGGTGGSGGGGGTKNLPSGPGTGGGSGGVGNTPPVSPPQGGTGGIGESNVFNPSGSSHGGGGGGGATVNGANGGPAGPGGAGGAGGTSAINGTPTGRGGGGGGGNYIGGGPATDGGATGAGPTAGRADGPNAVDNKGGGGGGATVASCGGNHAAGGNGGSGIVLIRYKFQ
jgi:hypothetical protein